MVAHGQLIDQVFVRSVQGSRAAPPRHRAAGIGQAKQDQRSESLSAHGTGHIRVLLSASYRTAQATTPSPSRCISAPVPDLRGE
jgi:hypothetical protein